MSTFLRLKIILPLVILGLSACEEPFEEDVVPRTFFMMQLNPDDIHIYNGGSPDGVRLDPLVNDSIKVEVTVSYSTPMYGIVKFIPNEGWFYVPNSDYFGLDNIVYTVCHKDGCLTSNITMYVEQPLDLSTCQFSIQGENIETAKDAPIGIRIFENDEVCPYMGMSLFSPEKGKFTTYSYSGTFRNTVYVYYPPKNYTGTDRFKYRLFTQNGQYIEAYCEITIK